MAEVIKGDNTKGIKSVGELALRISKFDSYRLFTLYENVRDKKIMDVSNQKFYLVFRSPKKEIRIPEYDPKGFFEVDKVNGCVLFKITKKNADDILSMKTAGEKIFYIIRAFEETDSLGKVLSVADEVEVYHGKWGDDSDFNTFTTENKVDLLTKALAAQVDKNQTLLNEYTDLDSKYNLETRKSSDLEKEIELIRAERDELQTLLNEYTGNTVEGVVLSTDTKYVAFENALDDEGVKLTEAQYQSAMSELLSKDMVTITDGVVNETNVDIKVKVSDSNSGIYYVTAKKNAMRIGGDMSGENSLQVGVNDNDLFRFNIEKVDGQENVNKSVKVNFTFVPFENDTKDDKHRFNGLVDIDGKYPQTFTPNNLREFTASVSFTDENGNYIDVTKLDTIGTFVFTVE
jgi:hypothetical protein